MSQIRQNYHETTEDAVNKAILTVLNASYQYLDLAYFFDRDDVALPNMHKYFLKRSEDKKKQVEKLLRYQNLRGGRTKLQNIAKPAPTNKTASITSSIEQAIQLEQSLNTHFLGLHEFADTYNDAHFSDFVEEDLLDAQTNLLKELADMLTQARRSGTGLGEVMFDHELEVE